MENEFLKQNYFSLFVADLFHPVGGLAVELFLDGDVCHSRGCRSAVPMLLTRREPDHVPSLFYFFCVDILYFTNRSNR